MAVVYKNDSYAILNHYKWISNIYEKSSCINSSKSEKNKSTINWSINNSLDCSESLLMQLFNIRSPFMMVCQM